uniref:Ig-like domain-containing protein n=1 Tax=Oryzias latipes TaxID=8090 RepID=A0A3P9JV10_ORYLA
MKTITWDAWGPSAAFLLRMTVFSFPPPGNTAEQVSGFTGGSVVLPCSCENRDTSEVFSWQKKINTQKPLKVFRLEGLPSYGKEFEERVELFYSENTGNCSILLKNIIGGDHGSYRCYWKMTPLKTLEYYRFGEFLLGFLFIIMRFLSVVFSQDNTDFHRKSTD